MLTKTLFQTPGDHPLMLDLPHGKVEASLVVPDNWNGKYIAILGHPHSLQGGAMTNKVVTTLARICRDLAIPSLKFNFRGVGQSEGVFDNGAAESGDMVMIAKAIQALFPAVQFILAGFSFGSYVTYRASQYINPVLLVSIAPPVNHYDYDDIAVTAPWVVVQGDEDEVVPASEVYAFFDKKPVTVLRFENTTHFFHGQLVALRDRLMPEIEKVVHAS